jgi:hypothetical protein
MSFYSSAQEKPKSKIVETIDFRTNQFDKIILTTEVYSDPKYQVIGSYGGGQFEKNGKTVFKLPDIDGYDSIDSNILEGIESRIKSPFVVTLSHKDVNYVMFQGFQFGCCPRYLVIVKDDKSGLKEIAKLEFDLIKVKKENDGNIMAFGQSSSSQGLADIYSLDISLSSYSPMLIYNLAQDFKLDSVYTKKYNEENYVFAGFEYSEKVTVARQRHNKNRKIDTIRPYIYKIEKP